MGDHSPLLFVLLREDELRFCLWVVVVDPYTRGYCHVVWVVGVALNFSRSAGDALASTRLSLGSSMVWHTLRLLCVFSSVTWI